MSNRVERASRLALKIAWWWFAIGGVGTVLLNGPQQLARLISFRDPEAAGGLAAYVIIAALLRWTYPLLWPKAKRGELPPTSASTTSSIERESESQTKQADHQLGSSAR